MTVCTFSPFVPSRATKKKECMCIQQQKKTQNVNRKGMWLTQKAAQLIWKLAATSWMMSLVKNVFTRVLCSIDLKRLQEIEISANSRVLSQNKCLFSKALNILLVPVKHQQCWLRIWHLQDQYERLYKKSKWSRYVFFFHESWVYFVAFPACLQPAHNFS